MSIDDAGWVVVGESDRVAEPVLVAEPDRVEDAAVAGWVAGEAVGVATLVSVLGSTSAPASILVFFFAVDFFGADLITVRRIVLRGPPVVTPLRIQNPSLADATGAADIVITKDTITSAIDERR